MTPVPFFLVPAALGSGLVIGALVGVVAMWWHTAEPRRRLQDARIVFATTVSATVWTRGEISVEKWHLFVDDMHRALSGKERK